MTHDELRWFQAITEAVECFGLLVAVAVFTWFAFRALRHLRTIERRLEGIEYALSDMHLAQKSHDFREAGVFR